MTQGNGCVAKCGKGYFEKDKACEKCEKHCMKCKSASKCTTCNVPYKLHNNDCLISCPAPLVNKNGRCV